MTSVRKIEANRKNAQKSTGPRTEEGRHKVRFNALQHGLCAETIVLPHEDATAYQNRLETWTADLKPRTDMEAYLIGRMVKLSWKLDRADAHERAVLAERIAEQRGKSQGGSSVELLMENLLLVPREAERLNVPLEDPKWLIEQLEATAGGCQALLDQWTGLWMFLARQQDGSIAPALPDESLVEFNRMTRLLGYTQPEADMLALMDENIMALHEIQLLINEDVAKVMRGESESSAGHDPLRVARLNAEIWPLVDQRYRRLTMLLDERLKEDSGRGDSEDLAAFDDSIEGDRLHRYQDQWGRALGRSLRELHLARKLTEDGESVGTKPASPAAFSATLLAIHHEEPAPVENPEPEPEPPDVEPVSAEQSQRDAQASAPEEPCGEFKIGWKAGRRHAGRTGFVTTGWSCNSAPRRRSERAEETRTTKGTRSTKRRQAQDRRHSGKSCLPW